MVSGWEQAGTPVLHREVQLREERAGGHRQQVHQPTRQGYPEQEQVI